MGYGVALASAALPAFAGHVAGDRREDLKRTVAFALKNIYFMMLPMTVFFLLLSGPLVRAIFERGEFTAESTAVTSSVLFFFSLGLMSYGGVKILAVAFHSLQDTRTPVKVAVISLIVNAVLNVTLMFPMQVSGIALASSLSAAVNVGLLYHFLDKRLGGFTGHFVGFLRKILLAGLAQVMAICASWYLLGSCPLYLRLALVFVVGVLAYAGAAWALGLDPAVEAVASLKRRLMARRRSG
jgi:putative peptidoglycan lipid II flippase